MTQRSPNQTVPAYKNPKKINHPLACSPFGKFSPSNFQEPGILQAPPPPFLSHSYPPFSLQPPAQPPLLPLPASTRGFSCPPTNRKTGNNYIIRTRDSPKRPNSSRKENKIISISTTTTPLGGNLTNTVAKASPLASPGSVVFAISPPPSSLPLPRFSLRPKLCCKVEAAGIDTDTGATDHLRRLLRLR
ncbi:uncharacterized protein [Henckelia pumila]|uniref:uncharacterized protein n=1 Tax=Henckelia pumila TaxID=405737 RepID=UPI003C6E55D2